MKKALVTLGLIIIAAIIGIVFIPYKSWSYFPENLNDNMYIMLYNSEDELWYSYNKPGFFRIEGNDTPDKVLSDNVWPFNMYVVYTEEEAVSETQEFTNKNTSEDATEVITEEKKANFPVKIKEFENKNTKIKEKDITTLKCKKWEIVSLEGINRENNSLIFNNDKDKYGLRFYDMKIADIF